jgi:hypothetical protein
MDNRLRLRISTGSRSIPWQQLISPTYLHSPSLMNHLSSPPAIVVHDTITSKIETPTYAPVFPYRLYARHSNNEVACIIIMCIPCCLCVSTSEVVIVERLGKFDRMLPAGLGIVCCPCEQTAGSVSFRKCLRQFWTMSYSMKLDACIANLLPPPTSPPFSEY